MSDANDKNPNEIPADDANDDFDFASFANEDEKTPGSENAFGYDPMGGFTSETQAEPTFDFDPTASEDDSVDSIAPADEAAPVDSEASVEEEPAMPSSFLSDPSESATDEVPAEEAAPVIAATDKKGKKAKKEKPKKEKKAKEPREKGPREPISLGGVLSLLLGILLLLGLIAVNALVVMAPATPGIGSSSTMYYLIGLNAFGLLVVMVPFLFWLSAKKLQLIDVQLGLALMALAIGVICFLTAIYRYDFTTKAAKPTTNVVQQVHS